MNTNEILTLLEIHDDCDGLERDGDGGLVFFLDQAQSILLGVPGEQNIVFGSDGRLPAFETKNNVYEYNAPDNSRKIVGVLVESYRSGAQPLISNYHYSDYGSNNSARAGDIEQDHILIAGIDYYRIPYIRSFDATDTAPARVVFTENPGDHGDLYRWYYYKKSNKLYSDSIPLSIDPPYDYLYLLPATLSLIQSFKDGDFEKGLQKVEFYRQKMNQALNGGEQGQNNNAVSRGF